MMKIRNGFILTLCLLALAAPVCAQRQMEKLDRGVVTVSQTDGSVFISWRLLATDADDIAFNVYRASGANQSVLLNEEPIRLHTFFLDEAINRSVDNTYTVTPVVDGAEWAPSKPHTIQANSPALPYLAIPMQGPAGTTPNDASVGDLDGDGDYEIVIHQASRGRDNSQGGMTGNAYLQAYTLEGDCLWTIDLGRNIREGAHYTQFMVYDLDGDGKAEIACKTADGTIDGTGKIIGDSNADYRNENGYILAGPEFLTIFDGQTGAALATTNYLPPRHPDTLAPSPQQIKDVWGDDYGNRVDRFLACIAYLDGKQPSLVMCRGYYTRTVLAAWNWRGGQLTHLWTFDSDQGYKEYAGQGYHSVSVGDVDQDGRDEIIYGACAIDDDGTGLYSTGLGHGDALHLSDIDPQRPGLEIFGIHERPQHPHGANLRDALTGEVIWSLELNDPGRGLAMDIDPRHPGYECWANNSPGLFNSKGERISETKPNSCNMGIWWDGDLLREILDGGRRSGAYIDKWNYETNTTQRLLDGGAYQCVTNNGTKANPSLCADILGDWREEVIWRTEDGSELRIFVSTIPTDYRLKTLMNDPVYRLSVAWQNVSYNQPAQPGFYFGDGMLTK
ncbi:MAG: rhamnogalacturonan lyase [Candidatus Hinthialibacter antarcticus]|nr:rhamnogalacturonan lyase [Candidatus Hinthialibacter antarcticus]